MKPIICVPLGDPAGVGPEIAIFAAQVKDVMAVARVLIVGDVVMLENAAKQMKINPKINVVKQDLSNVQESVVNVWDHKLAGLGAESVKMGEVNGLCGRAAFEYIKIGVDLAMQKKVDALATTPINKESFKAGGVDYIGHTEVLADLTNSHDPLTMFQVNELRVFFLTRHLSLIEACKQVTKERTLDYLHRCAKALKQLGINDPKIVVAGLNPHCGEHGLFGDEEDRCLTPAIEQANKEGLKVFGPKPADSVFHFALKGAWDAVLSLYHDQGHIATKMIDFERTISLTLGMPFLRTSVDHGTAFDIAGKGLVSSVSMEEAIKLAAIYAPKFNA